MTDQEIYRKAFDFLLTFDSITKEDIDEHLKPKYNKPEDLKKIYYRLCFHAKNANRKSNVIGDIDKLVMYQIVCFRK